MKMKLIDKHILRNFMVPFAYILLSLVGLFLVYDVSSKIGRFLRHHVSVLTILKFYSLYVPQLVVLGLPLVTLLAVVLGVGRMGKNNEVTAMRACGVSVLRIASPLFAAGLLLAVVSFVMFEEVVARTYGETKGLEEELRGKKSPQDAIEMGYFLTDEKGSLLQFIKYLPRQRLFEDISWQTNSANPGRKIIIKGFKAQWIEDSWWAFGVWVLYPDGTYSPFYRKMKMYEWEFRPEEVSQQKFPEEMTFGELRKNIRKFRISPEKVRNLKVQLHRRAAFPALNLLVIAVALPFAVRGGQRGGSIAAGVGVSMLLCVGYYGLSVLISLFSDFPPWLGVWLPNLLFGAGGIVATLRID